MLGGIEQDERHDISKPGVNLIRNKDITGKANSENKAHALINDNSYANIKLTQYIINYVGSSHNFGRSLNNIQIINLETTVKDLTNEIARLKEALNKALTHLDLTVI